MKKINTSN